MDITKLYYNELTNTQSTQEKSIELFKKIHKGDRKAYEKLLKNHLFLVVSVAKRYEHQGTPLVDLISEGNLGLMRAIEKYDINNGGTFGSYAKRWIKAGIIRNCMHNARLVKIPENISELLRTDRYTGSDSFKEFSIDTPFEDGGSYSDKLPDDQKFEIIQNEEEMLLSKKVERILDLLAPRDREIVQAIYGIGEEAMEVELAAKEFNLTSTRINQILRKSFKLLRENEETDRSSIHVNFAEYGSDEYSINVTDEITELLKTKKDIKANNKIAGDPCKGIAKSLKINYSIKGKTFTKRFSEGKFVILK